ncbi:MAG TPA: V-type ATP synthase subunit A [Angustibacter sp.]|nr:V-type ATP synthase subunit A [Angustibacter sp.]
MSGPLVEVDGLSGATMAELVTLGAHRLLAEVVSLDGTAARTQAYEYTGGLRPGDPVERTAHPLSARLGPHLLGGVFDGLLRPLTGAGAWLGVDDAVAAPLDEAPVSEAPPAWRWEAGVSTGQHVAPGDLLGTVVTAAALPHRVLVPAGCSGVVDDAAPAGAVDGTEDVAVVAGQGVPLTSWWPVRHARPVRERLEAHAPLVTGQRVIDLLFPIARGSTVAVPGGFGTGKTVLLQQVAKWCDADVIVYVGCGERGNEMADVLAELAAIDDPRSGGRLLDRTVIVANTSNMPMMAREASIYAAVTVGEYFRDMGLHAVVVADSTSRWAEALREMASRSGELPAEEGYPAGLSSALAAFYERAGRVRTLGGQEGSVTIIGAVSPQGGDFTEPVTAHTQRFVRGLWTLDRDLAYARHYPAVSWSGSFSRDVPPLAAWYARAGDPAWGRRRARVAGLLAEADQLGALADLMGVSALPGHERVVVLGGRLLREGVLQQSALSAADARCGPERAAALVDAVLDVVDTCDALVARGVPAAAVEEVDLTPVVRARELPGGESAQALSAIGAARDAVRHRLEELA